MSCSGERPLSLERRRAELPRAGAVLQACDGVRDAEFLKERGLALVDTPDGESLLQPRLEEEPEEKPKPRAPAKRAEDIADVPPAELFRSGAYAGLYGAFDADGLPSEDAAGAPLSKSQRKKLRKKLDVHSKKWSGAAKVEA